MNLSKYSIANASIINRLIAERYAVKYSPSFALMIAKEWLKRGVNNGRF